MPELPEVETVRRDLSDRIPGCHIVDVTVLDPRVVVGGTAEFARALTGRAVAQLDRLGKGLIVRLDDDQTLVVHLRMTGQLYTVIRGEAPRHLRVVLSLDDGRDLVYCDARRLGQLEVVPAGSDSRILANLGRDALTDPPTVAELVAALRKRRTAIKAFLLDQRYFSGIGNIYASEILFRCRLHPEEPCNRLTPPDARNLLEVTHQVLTEAIGERGTTITNYVTGAGRVGGFQYHLQVYRREGETCLREGCSGQVQRLVQGGRSTFLCPRCQRKKQSRAGAGIKPA